jgi:long-chain acyl-CoA synthetase
MANLAQMLIDTAAAHGDRAAVRLDDTTVPYSALEQTTQMMAGLLAEKGVDVGDRVGVMLPNLPYFPIAFFGALRRGAAVIPLNPLLKSREVGFQLGNAGAKALIGWHGFADAARAGSEEAEAELILVEPGEFEKQLAAASPLSEVAERDDQDDGVILYTSGTTGTPKGARLTHGALRSATRIAVDLVDPSPDSVTFGALPLFHVFGLTCGLNTSVAAGGCLTLLPRFEAAKALEILERDKVTVFLGVPTMYAALLHEEGSESADVSSLELCVSGGAAMPVEVLRAFEQRFDCKVLEGYGLSETTAIATFNRPDRERKPGSIGIPVEGVDVKLVDENEQEVAQGEVGEVWIRGPVVMRGYWNRPDATEEALTDGGWLKTGDLARVDEDGYYFIVDRKKELIIRGGFNVYPREIEEVIYEHPAVREAAVVGVPDERLGEEIAAAVVPKDGQQLDPAELRDYVKDRVAAYKYPRQVWLLDELPKGPTGKILKREIKPPADG